MIWEFSKWTHFACFLSLAGWFTPTTNDKMGSLFKRGHSTWLGSDLQEAVIVCTGCNLCLFVGRHLSDYLLPADYTCYCNSSLPTMLLAKKSLFCTPPLWLTSHLPQTRYIYYMCVDCKQFPMREQIAWSFVLFCWCLSVGICPPSPDLPDSPDSSGSPALPDSPGSPVLLQVLACKHLPTELLATPGERAGMLTQVCFNKSSFSFKNQLKLFFYLPKLFF